MNKRFCATCGDVYLKEDWPSHIGHDTLPENPTTKEKRIAALEASNAELLGALEFIESVGNAEMGVLEMVIKMQDIARAAILKVKRD